jgi:hypothetical protein
MQLNSCVMQVALKKSNKFAIQQIIQKNETEITAISRMEKTACAEICITDIFMYKSPKH